MALLGTLTDNFNNASLASKWFSYANGGTVTETTQLELALPASSIAGYYAGIENDNTSFDFTASYALAQVVQAVDASTLANQALVVYDSASDSLTNSVKWFIENGTLYARYYLAGVATNVYTVAFVLATHKWWRIREASGTFYWDTSTDGLTWTNRGSAAPGITKTAVNVNLEVSTYSVVSNPGTGIFDNFNLLTQQVTGTGIASVEAFGTAQVGRDETITTTSIASAEAFGTPSLLYEKLIYPTGFDAGGIGMPAVTLALLSSTSYDQVAKPTTAYGNVAKPTTPHTAVAKPTTAYSAEVL